MAITAHDKVYLSLGSHLFSVDEGNLAPPKG